MEALIKDVNGPSTSTVNGRSVRCQGLVMLTVPPSYGSGPTTTVFSTAKIVVQYEDDRGDWHDFDDGDGNEEITAAISRTLVVPGLKIRPQIQSADGSTVIPRVFVTGDCGSPEGEQAEV